MAHTVNVLKTQSFHFDFNGQNPIPKETDSFGQAVYFPITFWNDDAPARADFQTTVKFRINRRVDQNPNNRLAFFIAPVGTIFPPPGPGLKHIISVEFVTSANPNVDTQIVIKIPYPKTVAALDVGASLLNQEVTAVIQYDQAKKMITVKVTTPTTRSPYVLSYDYDLSTLLDQEVEVGLAATEGIDNHQVSKWDFTAILLPHATEE